MTSNGYERSVGVQDADAAFPILSTGRRTDDDNLVCVGENCGSTSSERSGERDVTFLGVYWLEVVAGPDVGSDKYAKDFQKRG